MPDKKRHNPGNPGFVSVSSCNARHAQINSKMDEMLRTLRGDPRKFDDAGIVGEIRDIKRDRKWIYALITIIGIPMLFLFFQYLAGGGG